MKVLGISSSPRRGGNTDLLLEEFLRGVQSKGAEVKTITLCKQKFVTCQHCDACLKAGICRINDDMQQNFQDMEESDVIVLASPVQFMAITADAKAFIDRCQCLWARKYVLKMPPLGTDRKRKGFFISAGGTKLKNLFEPSLVIVKTWFRILDIEYAGDLLFKDIDEKGAVLQHPDAMQQAFSAGQEIVDA